MAEACLPQGKATGAADCEIEVGRMLRALPALSPADLRSEWRRLYRSQPPRLSRDLLIRGIAYRIQELASGGLSKATRRALLSFGKELEAEGRLSLQPAPSLRPGARLVREWRGRTHTVIVRQEGFEYGGKLFPSLTKIARAITGAHWSGPRFFGLNPMEAPDSGSKTIFPTGGD